MGSARLRQQRRAGASQGRDIAQQERFPRLAQVDHGQVIADQMLGPRHAAKELAYRPDAAADEQKRLIGGSIGPRPGKAAA